MVNLQSNYLERPIFVNRVIGHLKGTAPGPTTVFIGGIHGNEPAGVFALYTVIDELKASGIEIKGNIYAIAGNLWALEHGKRYQSVDLNRLWSRENIDRLQSDIMHCSTCQDLQEQQELFECLTAIQANETGPFYFFDLHTTSSDTIPFITVNDNLLNRKFTQQYPMPIVLGIEEYLEGPLLSYVNEGGYVAFGFEGGQHDSLSAIENHIAFIYLSLAFSNCLSRTSIDFNTHLELLSKNTANTKGFFEIFDHCKLEPEDEFQMLGSFDNFQNIKKGQIIAVCNGKSIEAAYNGKLFMPLYQDQGDDGYFMIRSIPSFFLKLSAFLRKIRMDQLLTWLPGVRWQTKSKQALVVNKKLARFFTKEFFHLMGYRSKKIGDQHFVMKNREKVSRKADYLHTQWYNKKN